MAAPTEIGILISVKNRATAPLKKVAKGVKDTKKEIRGIREQMVLFNRALFTAAAIYGTFTGVLRRGFELSKIGGEFDFFREQFNKTFGGPEYLTKLRQATHGTMDAMSMMQLAVKNHARGMSKAESEKIFTLSVGAAKLLGTTTADAAKKMSSAMQSMSVAGMQQFMVALNTNNQFTNMNLTLQRLTKGLNAAGMKANVFRRIAMRELEITLGEVAAKGGDARQSMEALSASFTSVRQITGNFLSRGLAPLASFMSRKMWGYFDRLNEILSDTTGKFTSAREGLISFAQSAGMFLGVGASLFGSLTLLSFVSSALGLPLIGLAGVLLIMGTALKAIVGPSKGWLETLSDIGMVLKFVWQTFSTYSDGVSEHSSDVVEHIKGMSESGQSWITAIGKSAAWLKEVFTGMGEGIKSTLSMVQTAMSALGFDFGDIKQMSIGGQAIGQTIGKLAGIFGTLGIFIAGLKTLKSIGGMVTGGVKGALGKGPKGTITDPIYTASIGDLVGGLPVGALSKIGGLGGLIAKYGMASVLGAGGVAAAGGIAAGVALDHGVGMASKAMGGDGRTLSDRISDTMAFGGWKQKLDGTTRDAGAQKALGNEDLNSLVGSAINAGASMKDIFGSSLDDQHLTAEEMVSVLKKIHMTLERAGHRSPFPATKPSSGDQIF